MKNKWNCYKCNSEQNKSEFKTKTIQEEKVYVCQKCWYYNAPSIFN